MVVKILVVEDEHRIASSIKKGLEQEKYVADTAYDGVEGFDLAESGGYDLIILDLMLPGMDGMTICKKLREENIQTPILILTARGQLENKVQGLNSGADDYLVKPFAFEELLARIRALLRRPKNREVGVLAVEDLTLDKESFEVKRDGKTIALSNKEFGLLEYLMRNRGKIVSKEQIIERVWSYEAEILPNTIEVYIKNLRRKIDSPFKNKKLLLETVRGFGYRLGGGNV